MLTDITSDPLLNVVLWATAILAVVATAMTIWAGTLRFRQTLHAARESRLVARWRPLLLETVDAIPSHLPRVKQPDWFVFLILWNQFHASIRGPARHRLKAVALRLRMDSAARGLLDTRSVDNRLVAVTTLGHLGDQDSWNIVEEIARSPKPLLSMAALRSLFFIDASRATAVALSSLGARSDWPTAQLKAIVAEADQSTVSEELVQAAEIAAAHPGMLFVVSAGNDGRDIDRRPVYPAALALDNMIVVTSADGFGQPAPGSNWGKQSVDVLVPGERVPVIDFHGVATIASGSSFAAPRVTALAARLAAANPEWRAAELKAALIVRARMTDAAGPLTTRYGFLDPSR